MAFYREIANRLIGLAEGDERPIPAKDMAEVSKIRSVLNKSCKLLGWKLVKGSRYATRTVVADNGITLYVRRPIANTTKTIGEELADRLDLYPRLGAARDIPEGTRYILVSDTLTQLIASELRKSKVGQVLK